MYKSVNFYDQTKKNPRIEKKPSFVRLPWNLKEKITLFDRQREPTKKKAQEDALKETEKNRDIAQTRFDNLVSSSQKVLYELSAVFPFDFFPDHMSIEPAQINVAQHYFFYTAELRSIPVKNIADVFLDTSFFFASIKIIDASFIENSVQVEYLKKSEACKARCIIQGLVLAHRERIDLFQLPRNELAQKAEELGMARNVDLIDHPN